MKKFLVMAIVCSSSHAFAAEEQQQRQQPQPQQERSDHFRIGAIGGVGFPRPLAIEPMMVIERTIGLGVEYGGLPEISTSNVRVSAWSLAGDARWFIAKGPFFLGMKVGMQHLQANGTMSAYGYSISEELGIDTWFLNPRAGLLYTWKPGFTIGFDVGVQLPVASSTSSTIPMSLMPTEVQSTANALGMTVLPTVDLLRIGFLY